MKERTPHTQGIDEKTFSIVRKGYDTREVKDFLEDLEHAFHDIEGHARRTSQRVVDSNEISVQLAQPRKLPSITR